MSFETKYENILQTGVNPFIELIDTGNGTKFNTKDFIAIYDKIYELCTADGSRTTTNVSRLYQEYRKIYTDYISSNDRFSFLDNIAITNNSDLYLTKFNNAYEKYKYLITGLEMTFRFLDRSYAVNSAVSIVPTENKTEVRTLAFYVFKTVVYDVHKNNIINAVTNILTKQRETSDGDSDLVRKTINNIIQLSRSCKEINKALIEQTKTKDFSLYTTDVQNNGILPLSEKYYMTQSNNKVEQVNAHDYIHYVNNTLKSEVEVVQNYLHSSTKAPLYDLVYNTIMKDKIERLQIGIETIFKSGSTEGAIIKLLYSLISYSEPDVIKVSGYYEIVISILGKAKLNMNTESGKPIFPENFVDDLIELHTEYNNIINDNMNKSQIFQKALKNGFQKFINSSSEISRELARYCNKILIRDSKVEITEQLLDNIIFLYSYIQDKDIFEHEYQILLGNRLLRKTIRDDMIEKSFIAKFKAASGYAWSSKLEVMFNDISKSRILCEEILREYPNQKVLPTVITNGNWLNSKITKESNIPLVLKNEADVFIARYLSANSSHKLTPKFDVGTAEVEMTFGTRKYLFNVTTYQMIILSIFTELDTVTFKQLLELTQIPKVDLANNILSMCNPKLQIIQKNPNTPKIAEDGSDKFRINPGFTSQVIIVKVPLNTNLYIEEHKEQDENDRYIQLQRKTVIQSTIVRIMKSRKTLTHQVLIGEVISQIKRFVAIPQDIKKNIEDLIEQEYIERDPEDRSKFIYKA